MFGAMSVRAAVCCLLVAAVVLLIAGGAPADAGLLNSVASTGSFDFGSSVRTFSHHLSPPPPLPRLARQRACNATARTWCVPAHTCSTTDDLCFFCMMVGWKMPEEPNATTCNHVSVQTRVRPTMAYVWVRMLLLAGLTSTWLIAQAATARPLHCGINEQGSCQVQIFPSFAAGLLSFRNVLPAGWR